MVEKFTPKQNSGYAYAELIFSRIVHYMCLYSEWLTKTLEVMVRG